MRKGARRSDKLTVFERLNVFLHRVRCLTVNSLYRRVWMRFKSIRGSLSTRARTGPTLACSKQGVKTDTSSFIGPSWWTDASSGQSEALTACSCKLSSASRLGSLAARDGIQKDGAETIRQLTYKSTSGPRGAKRSVQTGLKKKRKERRRRRREG